MKQNPRTPKTQKMAEEKVSNEAESWENSSSDDAKTLENEATEYEKQRELRIAQNKARMEAMGFRKIANSLMNLSQKKGEKRKSKVNSKKRAVKNGKEDDEYDPANEDEDDDDDNGSDTSLNSSSEEFEEKGKNKKKKKRAIEGNFGCSSEKGAQQVQPSVRPEALGSQPSARPEALGSQPSVRPEALGSQPSVRPEASQPSKTSCPPTIEVSCPQRPTSNYVASPIQPDFPMFPFSFPSYKQFAPNWCPPMGPFGMAPISWNPSRANYPLLYMCMYPVMPYYNAQTHQFPTSHSSNYGSA